MDEETDGIRNRVEVLMLWQRRGETRGRCLFMLLIDFNPNWFILIGNTLDSDQRFTRQLSSTRQGDSGH